MIERKLMMKELEPEIVSSLTINVKISENGLNTVSKNLIPWVMILKIVSWIVLKLELLKLQLKLLVPGLNTNN